MDVEGELLRSDKAIKDEDYAVAKDILYHVLSEQPESGRAHNDLGWLYHRHFSDSDQAEKHYRFALKFTPKYASPYLNYIYLLRDQGRIVELENILIQAEKIDSISRSSIYDEFGSLYELKGDYDMAIEQYKKSIKYTLSSDYIEDLKKHIKRCKDKKDFFRGNRIYKAIRILIKND